MKKLLLISIVMLVAMFAPAQFTRKMALRNYRPPNAGPPAGTAPTMVQHVSVGQSYNAGINNNQLWRLPLPELTLAGNCVLLGVQASVPSGSTAIDISIGDDMTNTWTRLLEKDDGVATTVHMWIYAAYNVKAGMRMIYVTNSASTGGIFNVATAATEFNNVASASALDVAAGNFGTSATVTSGSITPTVAGDLLWQFSSRYKVGAAESGLAHLWSTNGQANIGWKLLSADLQDSIAVQFGIYNATATINPTITMADSTDFLSGTVALKASATPQGSPRTTSQMQIVSLIHQGQDNVSFPKTNLIQWPSYGNLLVMMGAGGSTNWLVTNIVDTCGNVWRSAGGLNGNITGQDSTQVFYVTNAITSPTNRVTMYYWGTTPGHWTWWMYDVANAPPVAYDGRTVATGDQTGNASFLTQPGALTASTNEGIMFMCVQWEFNTATNISTNDLPGAMFDAVVGDGFNLDGPVPVDQNGGIAHYHNTNQTPNVMKWLLKSATDPNRQWAAQAVMFDRGCTNPPPAGISFVQSKSLDGGSGTDSTLTFSSSVTAGNLIGVIIREGANGGTVTVTNLNGANGSDTWALADSIRSADLSSNLVYYAKNVGGTGTCKVGIHLSVGSTIRYAIFEIAGCSTTAPFDTSNKGTATGTAIDSGTFTTANANEIIIGSLCVENGQTFTAGASFTKDEEVASKICLEHRIVNATGTYSASGTIPSDTWTAVGVAFK